MRAVISLAVLCACGPSWSDADTTTARESAQLAAAIETLEQGVDGGGPVRAMERAQFCNQASLLARHKLPPVDAGIRCTAP